MVLEIGPRAVCTLPEDATTESSALNILFLVWFRRKHIVPGKKCEASIGAPRETMETKTMKNCRIIDVWLILSS